MIFFFCGILRGIRTVVPKHGATTWTTTGHVANPQCGQTCPTPCWPPPWWTSTRSSSAWPMKPWWRRPRRTPAGAADAPQSWDSGKQWWSAAGERAAVVHKPPRQDSLLFSGQRHYKLALRRPPVQPPGGGGVGGGSEHRPGGGTATRCGGCGSCGSQPASSSMRSTGSWPATGRRPKGQWEKGRPVLNQTFFKPPPTDPLLSQNADPFSGPTQKHRRIRETLESVQHWHHKIIYFCKHSKTHKKV